MCQEQFEPSILARTPSPRSALALEPLGQQRRQMVPIQPGRCPLRQSRGLVLRRLSHSLDHPGQLGIQHAARTLHGQRPRSFVGCENDFLQDRTQFVVPLQAHPHLIEA